MVDGVVRVEASKLLGLTDVPCIRADHLTAGGEADHAGFRAFNTAWIGACLPHLCDGGLIASFIDWRSYPAIVAAALQLGLAPFDLIVWAKTNGAMGSLYRSQHELRAAVLKATGETYAELAVRRQFEAEHRARPTPDFDEGARVSTS